MLVVILVCMFLIYLQEKDLQIGVAIYQVSQARFPDSVLFWVFEDENNRLHMNRKMA